jgi:hypothetical protein
MTSGNLVAEDPRITAERSSATENRIGIPRNDDEFHTQKIEHHHRKSKPASPGRNRPGASCDRPGGTGSSQVPVCCCIMRRVACATGVGSDLNAESSHARRRHHASNNQNLDASRHQGGAPAASKFSGVEFEMAGVRCVNRALDLSGGPPAFEQSASLPRKRSGNPVRPRVPLP